MKITIEPETPQEIELFKPVVFAGLQSVLAVGLIHDGVNVEQGMQSILGNTMLIMDQIQVIHHQLMHARAQAAAQQQQQQQRIQVPNLQFPGGNGKGMA